MGKKISTLGDIEIEKDKLYCYKCLIFKKMYLTRFSSGAKTINTLLVTCNIIVKLNHYM